MFELRTFPQIYGQMVARVIAETPLDDLIPGSVFTTFLEAAAIEDDEQYFQMLQIINNYSLDSTTGEDLDARAAEYDVYRVQASKAYDFVTIGDEAFDKVETGVYSGLQAPRSGQNYIYGDSLTDFTATGSIIIGRGKTTVEKLAYSSIDDLTTHVKFNLTTNLVYDHGTDESIVMAQGGDRLIAAGAEVLAEATDKFPEIVFITQSDAVILDGEVEATSIPIIAEAEGTDSNVPIGASRTFRNKPFSTATVTNPAQITNGKNEQTDEELRDAIKLKVQSLSKGVKKAILSEVLNFISPTDYRRVVSASLIERVAEEDISILYIDDGSGIVFNIDGVSDDVLVTSATGGEQFLRLPDSTVPVVKAFAECNVEGPWDFSAGIKDLVVRLGDVTETVTFTTADFADPTQAEAKEIVDVINADLSEGQARVSSGGDKVRIFSKANFRESVQVTGGTANDILAFPIDLRKTISLYLTRDGVTTLLSKDGRTASVECANDENYNLSGGETLTLIVDAKSANVLTATFQAGDFATPGSATAEEVVARINEEIPGAIAYISSGGTKVSIFSNLDREDDSRVQVTGGSANAELGFPTTESQGAALDFALNRFSGEIKLVDPLLLYDRVEVGLTESRTVTFTAAIENYNLSGGETLNVTINGTYAQVVTFQGGDFATPGSASAAEVIARINLDLAGATASLYGSTRVQLISNTLSEDGSIQVTGGTANTELQFPTTIHSNFQTHQSYLENSVDSPYAIQKDQSLVIVVDGNTANTIVIDFGNFGIDGYSEQTEVLDQLDMQVSPAPIQEITTLTFPDHLSASVASGTDGTDGSSLAEFSDETYNSFAVGDVGRHIEVTGSGANDGFYEITSFVGIDTVGISPSLSANVAYSEVTTFTMRADAGGDLDAKYFTIYDEDGSVGVWFDVDNSGTGIPAGASAANRAIEVTAVNTGDSAINVAAAVHSAINADAKFTSIDNLDGTLTVTLVKKKSVSDAVDGDVGGAFSVNVDTQGVDPTLNWTMHDTREINGEYFTIYDEDGSVAIWFDLNNSGTAEPSHGADRAIEVTTANVGDADTAIAAATHTVINGDAKFSSVDNADGTITVTLVEPGAVVDASTGSMDALFSVNVDTQGEDSLYELDGYRYLLTVNPGAVHADWDGAAAGDIVEFNGTTELWEVKYDASVATNGIVNVVDEETLYKHDGATTWSIATRTAKEVAAWLADPVNNSLSSFADITTTAGGNRIQISSKTVGADGRVQVAGGTANNVLTFPTYEVRGTDAYSYYTGLPQEVQWLVDGKPSDEDNYPGVKAAGVQIEVAEPVVKDIILSLDIETEENVTITSVEDTVRTEISSYINGLPVGGDVILASIITAAKGVSGVYDCQIQSPIDNISIADYEKPKIIADDISIS